MISWIDWDYPQSAVALHIYRVGRSVPVRSQKPIKSRVKIQLLTRIGCFGHRSDRGAGLPGGITPSSGLRIGRSIYAFRSSRRDLRNGVVQFVIWQTCLDRSELFKEEVWPVYPDCPENLHRTNFECQHMPSYFLVKLAYQEIYLQAQNALEQREAPTHQSCLALKDDIIYRPCQLV